MTDVAIIGDLFMLPRIFEEQIRHHCASSCTMRSQQQPWPDEPMVHGYEEEGLNDLKEYFGKPDHIADFIGQADIFITHLAPVTGAMLERLPNLKMIAVSRGGPTNIDIQACQQKNIRLVNAPGRNASAVAEFTLGAILSETRLIRSGHESMRDKQWRGDLYRLDNTGREMSEMTIGVIGYGYIGSRVVSLLNAFGARVLVCDPYVQLTAAHQKAGVGMTDLDDILATSDVITMHPRVTKQTIQMIDTGAFARMKKGAIFINTARGPLVDYDALYQALRDEHLKAAVLDTFAIEPVPQDWPLLTLPNVTLTPHIAGASVRTVTHAAQMIAQEIDRFLSDKPPINPVS
ncbi:MAG: 2-hydroxyacid dehydrogenase [Pseudomonadota bacterium]